MRVACWALLVAACTQQPETTAPNVASRRLLAAGDFREPAIDGSSREGGTVVALADADEEGGTVTLVPFDGGEPCSGPRASHAQPLGVVEHEGVHLRDDPMRLVVFGPSEDDALPVRFLDRDCNDRPPILEAPAHPPLIQDGIEGRGLFVRDTDGAVLRVDPWRGRAVTLASGVEQLEVGADASLGTPRVVLWLREGTAVVQRDSDGRELARTGTAVSELRLVPPGDVVFVDGGAIYSWRGGTSEPRLLDEDACEPTVLDSTHVAYLSPCADRSLVVYDLFLGERLASVADGVGGVRAVGTHLFYVLGDSAEVRRGALYARPLTDDAPSRQVIDDGDLESVRFVAGAFLALRASDGVIGQLGVWRAELGWIDVLPDVADLRIQGFVAVLAAVRDGTGTLLVVDPIRLMLLPSPAAIESQSVLVAHGVPPGGFRFADAVFAIDYLESFDPTTGTGTLRTWVVPDEADDGLLDEPGRGFVVDDGVRDFTEILWPDAGMLYTVGAGSQAGLWFADWVGD